MKVEEIIKKVESEVRSAVRFLEEREKRMADFERSRFAVVRECSRCIKMIHSGNIEKAEKSLSMAKEELEKAKSLSDCPEETFVAEQEFVEASCLMAVKKGMEFPGVADLGVDYRAYLTGLMDLVGELKREMYGLIIKGKTKEADSYFSLMEGIFDSLSDVAFPERVIREFRRKQDIARIQVEQARSHIAGRNER